LWSYIFFILTIVELFFILTIVELFFILTIVELLHRATTKFFCHILSQTKKKKKFHSLALALALTLTLTVTLLPDHSAIYKALLTTAVHYAIFNAPTLHNVL